MGVEAESTQTVVDGGDEEINLNIRCSNGNKFSVRATLRSTVAVFKDLLAQNCDVPANQQRLIYKGRILKDDQTLDTYGKHLFYFEILMLLFLHENSNIDLCWYMCLCFLLHL